MDLITINLFVNVFSFNNLQFAYQEKILADMNTWDCGDFKLLHK